ncbi:hypothetical protein MLD38_027299 [Melastoma candidum]|uniref:Uncharacterized protein n=1 Tax=Melastoma candidum TaxID=119954 RepID=A0ACB9P440_9MYRT|nr:hypothetical protein MLD38_027299 [Melastoma candidum]
MLPKRICPTSFRLSPLQFTFRKARALFNEFRSSSPPIIAKMMLSSLKTEDQSQLQLVEREEIDDEEDLFEAIDKLISHGINAGDVKKLQDAGIYTCNGLMMHTKKHLNGIKGLSEAKVDKICEAEEKIVNFGYISGSDALLKVVSKL